jgi:hypothetical protein
MKFIVAMAVAFIAFSITTGCSTTTKQEKEAYFEQGGMDDQVQSWKKPGGRY